MKNITYIKHLKPPAYISTYDEIIKSHYAGSSISKVFRNANKTKAGPAIWLAQVTFVFRAGGCFGQHCRALGYKSAPQNNGLMPLAFDLEQQRRFSVSRHNARWDASSVVTKQMHAYFRARRFCLLRIIKQKPLLVLHADKRTGA